MSTTSISNDLHEERAVCYQLFLHYYRGDLNQLAAQDWNKLAQVLKEQMTIGQNKFVQQAIAMLEMIDADTIETYEYDYNRLFIGPNRLLASPFESSYENIEGSTMQNETMKVRNFYYHEGLQLANEGTFPDDHIQFELEFMLHLLSQVETEEKKEIQRLFLQKHLLKWCPKHCERIEKHSQNQLTLAMAYLLTGFLQIERMIIEGGVTDDN